MIHLEQNSPLGKKQQYKTTHDPSVLFAIERQPRREEQGISKYLNKMHGYDVINAYELSWLDIKGKPEVAMCIVKVPSSSKYLIESKSLKLYLNSLNNHSFASSQAVIATIKEDLSANYRAVVELQLLPLSTPIEVGYAKGKNIDSQDINGDFSKIRVDALHTFAEDIEESLHSHLFKANCLVTGQPDWATVEISYRGKRIDQKGLLQYLISYRNTSGFSEHCIEQIFVDILSICKPEELTIYGRYTRRGGIDINPFRSTRNDIHPNNIRLLRC